MIFNVLKALFNVLRNSSFLFLASLPFDDSDGLFLSEFGLLGSWSGHGNDFDVRQGLARITTFLTLISALYCLITFRARGAGLFSLLAKFLKVAAGLLEEGFNIRIVQSCLDLSLAINLAAFSNFNSRSPVVRLWALAFLWTFSTLFVIACWCDVDNSDG